MYLLLMFVLASPGPGLPLEAALARRAYATTAEYLMGTLAHDSTNVFTLRCLARLYDHWHKYDSSLLWWERAHKLAPDHDSTITGRWNALYRRDEKDSARLAATKLLIRDEASEYLSETTARGLTLAYDGLALSDSGIAAQTAWLLAERFPDSPRAYEVIGSMFYDSLYLVWTNDTLRIPIIRRFLARLARTEWRQQFYMFLLSSRFGLKDTAGLRKDAAEMVADDTLDPFRCRYAAALFNRLKFDPETAARYALTAIRLEPKAAKPANKPPAQWDLEHPVLYGQARAALAEALMAQGRLDEAAGWLRDAQAGFRWDVNSEWTPAPFFCLLGEIAEKRGITDEAARNFVLAMEAGDSRNIWTARADTGFRRLRDVNERVELSMGRAALSYAGPVFTDVTDSFGLKDRHESRVAWGDYNNDGFDDLLLNGSVLLRNDTGRGFTDVTDLVGLKGTAGRGGLWADYNNDGWLDIYVPGGDTVDRLFRNDSGRFTDATREAGWPSDPYPTEGVGWADFDNDGWVDLYCANYENWEKHSYYPDRLYQNRQGVFADVTKAAGIVPPYGFDLAGRGVNWGDFNDDGYPDCYVSDYRLCENLFWVNNGDSTFSNQAGQLGVAGDEVNGWYGHTIGSEWGDYDNDGDLDLFCANLAHPRYIEFSNRSMLYNNLLRSSPGRQPPTANQQFVDCRAAAGIRYEETHSDPAWADVDNDGDLDLYITSIYEGRRSFLYQNQLVPFTGAVLDRPGGAYFSEVTWPSGTRVYNGWGCAFADFDNDGDQDLVVGSGSGLRLFRNDSRGNHWLEVKVAGTKANRAGIGARVTVTQGRARQIREVEGGKGTTSQNSLIQHFGLGANAAPVTVEVRFGPTSRVVLRNIKPDQIITVKETQ
jgi:tetratricopeptide (TPR) repeat protein